MKIATESTILQNEITKKLAYWITIIIAIIIITTIIIIVITTHD